MLIFDKEDGYYEALRKIDAAWESESTWLNLSDLKLTEVPHEIIKLQDLMSLDLRDNELAEFPHVIAQLRNLEVLDLTGNRLTEIPSRLGLKYAYH
jgi:Leucine-rich repeat (LRR) protein